MLAIQPPAEHPATTIRAGSVKCDVVSPSLSFSVVAMNATQSLASSTREWPLERVRGSLSGRELYSLLRAKERIVGRNEAEACVQRILCEQERNQLASPGTLLLPASLRSQCGNHAFLARFPDTNPPPWKNNRTGRACETSSSEFPLAS